MSEATRPIDPQELHSHAARLHALARRLVVDAGRADDVVQQALVASLERPPRIDVPLGPWLVGVVRNVARRTHRAESRRSRYEWAGPARRDSVTPDEIAARSEAFRDLADAVHRLSSIYRDVVVLHYFDGLAIREVAERLDVPTETVRTRLRRALVQLRQRLVPERGGDGRAWCAAVLPFVARPASPTTWGLVAGGLTVTTKTKVVIGCCALLLMAVSTCVVLLDGGSAPPAAQPSGKHTAAAPDHVGGDDGPGDRRRRVHVPRIDAGDEPVTDDDPGADGPGSDAPADAPRHENLPEGPAAVGELVGRVLLFPDRSPIEGVVVRVRGGGPGRHVAPYPEPGRVTTGPNGIFRIAGFAPGTYSFEAVLPGRAARQFRVAFTAEQGPDEVEVLFGAGGHVVGRVETANGPAEGVTVRINPPSIGGGRGLLSCATDAAGGYRFEDLPPGAYRVDVDGDGAYSVRTASVTVTAGETARVDFLHRASLVGVLRWDGEPLAGAIVRVTRTGEEYRSEQSASGENGSFQIDGLEPGEHRITVQVLPPPQGLPSTWK